MWAVANLRLDREQRLEDLEWQSIMGGAFTNPEMASKVIEEKERLSKSGAKSPDDEVRRIAVTQSERGIPAPDPDVKKRILGDGSDDIQSLSDLAEKHKDADD